jgi:hypothetical protein
MRACCSCPPRWGDLRYGCYRVPVSSGCDFEHSRYHMYDVPGLDEFQREAELRAIVDMLAVLPAGSCPLERWWLLERRRRLIAQRPGERDGTARAACPTPRSSESAPDDEDCDALLTRALGVKR